MSRNYLNLDEDLTCQIIVHKNLGQEIIVTNTDKVKIILDDHHKIIKRKNAWINPVSVFISVLTTILTANFSETKFGISSPTWQSIFILVCIASLIWSIVSIINAVKYLNKGTIDQCIEKMKINNPGIQNTSKT